MNNNRPNLTIIKGGLPSGINDMQKQFISGYVTNTRLMGVLAVHACWQVLLPEGCDGPDDEADLHQFFYIDCEEAGLETYTSHRGDEIMGIGMTEQAIVGGLGAEKVSLSEKSVRWLLCHWRDFNLEKGLPLPKNSAEYSFVLEEDVYLTAEEQSLLMESICGKMTSDYQVVNYFLMRCFGRDYEGARYLTASKPVPDSGMRGAPLADDFPLDLYDRYEKTTFCRNVVDIEKKYSDGSVSYLCESLVEMNGNHETVISRVVVQDLNVIGFEHCSGFRVSAEEAAMMLSKPEFVTVYEVLLGKDDMDENIGEFTIGLNTIMSTHESGRLFMAFKPNNDHVGERIFMLSNDVKGIYFLTDFGQLILAAYSLRDIKALERTLSVSPLAPYLVPTSKYEFTEPILYEFIKSGFDDFDEFLK